MNFIAAHPVFFGFLMVAAVVAFIFGLGVVFTARDFDDGDGPDYSGGT